MPNFENYSREAAEIEHEILRHGIALGIDWQNETQVRALAREALACHDVTAARNPETPQERARVQLFGLTQLMLTVMRQSADENVLTHGGPVWKAFARALWAESGMDQGSKGG